MKLEALYAGSITRLEPEGQPTGIFKAAIESAQVDLEGITIDHQADRRFHGGPEKALHQFAVASYSVLTNKFPELAGVAIPGSLGENISCTEMTEKNVFIGDIYRIGSVLVQVSQPRSPCWKINHKYGIDNASRFIADQHICGWYYRVLESGSMQVGDSIELVQRVSQISLDYFIHTMLQHRPKIDDLSVLVDCLGLASDWQKRVRDKLKFLQNL